MSATCSSNVRHSFISLSVSRPHTQSHSAITLASEPITHSSTTCSTHAANGGADHAPTCACRLVSFLLAILTDTILRFSHCISTDSNGALNPPRTIASIAYSRGSLVSVLKPLSPLPNTARCLLDHLFMADDRKGRSPSAYRARTYASNSQRDGDGDGNGNPNHFQ